MKLQLCFFFTKPSLVSNCKCNYVSFKSFFLLQNCLHIGKNISYSFLFFLFRKTQISNKVVAKKVILKQCMGIPCFILKQFDSNKIKTYWKTSVSLSVLINQTCKNRETYELVVIIPLPFYPHPWIITRHGILF